MNNLFTRYLLLVLIPANFAVANDDNVAVLKDTVDGKSLNEYANIWWQWAASMPDKQSAVSDRTGKFCDLNQHGPVWFLAGGYGSSKIKRQCTIPKDKYLFFPVINMVYYDKSVPDPEKPRPKLSCDQAKALAALNNDKLNSFVVTIDNQKIVNPAAYRYSSPECFDLMALIPKEYKAPTVYPSASDGYWIMVKPLAVGPHKITFHGEYGRDGGSYGHSIQDIEYELEIVDR